MTRLGNGNGKNRTEGETNRGESQNRPKEFGNTDEERKKKTKKKESARGVKRAEVRGASRAVRWTRRAAATGQIELPSRSHPRLPNLRSRVSGVSEGSFSPCPLQNLSPVDCATNIVDVVGRSEGRRGDRLIVNGVSTPRLIHV